MVAALPTRNRSESERSDALCIDRLMKAARSGDTAQVIDVVLSGDVGVNSTTQHGTTPLMSAAAYGHLEIVRTLLKHGAAVNQKRSDGFTALTLAAFFGQKEIVSELLASGADVRAMNRSRTSAEMWASARGFLKIADLLRTAREHSIGARAPKALAVSVVQAPPTAEQEDGPREVTLLKQRGESVADNSDALGPPAGEAGNQSRRVYRIIEPTAAPIELERGVDPVVPFSPLSALLDRLSTSWQQSAALLLLVILSGGVVFAILETVKRRTRPQPTGEQVATSSAKLPELSQPPVTQPAPPQTEQARLPVNSSPEVRQAEEGSGQASDHAAAVSSKTSANESSLSLIRIRTEAKGSVSAAAPHDNQEGKSARAKRRVGRVTIVSGNGNEPTASNDQLVETKQQVPPARTTRTSAEVPTVPAEPIKGSTVKRKVIQWP